MAVDYQHLMFTDEYWRSIETIDPALTDNDVAGVVAALDYLDSHPTDLAQRLHRLDRELTGWWSLTPPTPADQKLRVLLRPEQTARGGHWRLGPITWHYHR